MLVVMASLLLGTGVGAADRIGARDDTTDRDLTGNLYRARFPLCHRR
jgi:hypothetical protein